MCGKCGWDCGGCSGNDPCWSCGGWTIRLRCRGGCGGVLVSGGVRVGVIHGSDVDGSG